VLSTVTMAKATKTVSKKRKSSDLEDLRKPKRVRGPSASTNQDLPAQVALGDLPDELLVKIFSYLQTKDLHAAVSRVCKRFHRISQDAGANIAVQIPRREWNEDELDLMLQFLDGKNKIQEVELNHIKVPGVWKDVNNDFGVDAFRLMFKLAVLDQKMTKSLKLSGYVAPALEMLKNKPEKAKQIQKFHLFFGIEDEEYFLFDKKEWSLPKMTNMTNFKVSCFSSIFIEDEDDEDACGNFITDIAMSSKSLESFTADNVMFGTGQCIDQLLDRHGQRLKKLELDQLTVSNRTARYFAQHKSTMLEELQLCGGNSSFSTDLVDLLQLKNLKKMDLSCQNSLVDLKSLASSVDINKVEWMDLRGFQEYFELSLQDSCLTLQTWERRITPDVVLAFLCIATQQSGLEKLLLTGHRQSSSRQYLPNRKVGPTFQLELNQGKTCCIQATSDFPSEKLSDLTHHLMSSSFHSKLQSFEVYKKEDTKKKETKKKATKKKDTKKKEN